MTPDEAPLDLDELEKVARAASHPGPWFAYFTTHGDPYVITDEQLGVISRLATIDTGPEDYGRGTADFIAAASPSTVLDLIRELREAREAARLGMAWKEAEEALPEGWELHVSRSFWRKGWVAYASQYQLAGPGEPGRQSGEPYQPPFESEPFPGSHDTPTAALQALTAKLRERGT